MYEMSVRQMNERERAELRGRLFRAEKAKGTGLGCLLGAPISIAGAICLWMLAKELLVRERPLLAEEVQGSGPPWYWLPICIALSVCGPALSIWRAFVLVKEHRQAALKLHEEMDSGSVEVERIEASAVVELLATSEHDAQTPVFGYVFDVGGGQVLLLPAARMEPTDVAGQPWPSTVFEVVRTAKHKVPIGIFPCGGPLPPVRSAPVDGDALRELKETAVWKGSLNTLETELLEQFGQARGPS
jgi:hypothetical protein